MVLLLLGGHEGALEARGGRDLTDESEAVGFFGSGWKSGRRESQKSPQGSPRKDALFLGLALFRGYLQCFGLVFQFLFEGTLLYFCVA